jgi:hypothetical protein
MNDMKKLLATPGVKQFYINVVCSINSWV